MIVDNQHGMVFELDENSALDIASLRLDGIEIAPGDAVPDDGDSRILHSVAGFLFTCGPDHKGHPEPVESMPGKTFPLHGSMAATKADGLNISESGAIVTIDATITVILVEGGVAEIHRRWQIDHDTGEVQLRDTLTNTGDQSFPPMWMYHMNIGAQLFDANTMLSGSSFEDGRIGWRFGDGDGHVFCVAAQDQGEAGGSEVILGPIAGAGGKSLTVRFFNDTLPYLQMWRNQAGHCNVLGIEPVSHPLKPRTALQALGLLSPLAPGASQHYGLSFRFG